MDLDSLRAHASLVRESSESPAPSIPIEIVPDPSATNAFLGSVRTDLLKNSTFDIEISSGVRILDTNMPTENDEGTRFVTIGPLGIEPQTVDEVVAAEWGRPADWPFVGGAPVLHFTNDVPAVPLDRSIGHDAGMRLVRRVTIADGGKFVSFAEALHAGDLAVSAGTVVAVDDRIATDGPEDGVLLTDPVPAGFEAIDGSLATASAAERQSASSSDDEFRYTSIGERQVVAYAPHLPYGWWCCFGASRPNDVGTFHVRYLMRAVTPGSYAWPSAYVEIEDEPETYGKTSSSRITIRP